MLPARAAPLVAARAAGKRPASMVIVADGADCMGWPNPTVMIDPSQRLSGYDFKFLAWLEVEIATRGDARRSIALINAILRVKPYSLQVHWLDDDSLLCVVSQGDRIMQFYGAKRESH
jgi:hypothetical protein